jgi:hypothetical protein
MPAASQWNLGGLFDNHAAEAGQSVTTGDTCGSWLHKQRFITGDSVLKIGELSAFTESNSLRKRR